MSHGPAEWDVQETLIARLRREAEVRDDELAKLRVRLEVAEHELEDLRAIRDALTPPELPGRPGLEYGISHVSDNVVLLQYLRRESRLLRIVTILKSRASAHDPEIREFDITPDGIILGDPIAHDDV